MTLIPYQLLRTDVGFFEAREIIRSFMLFSVLIVYVCFGFYLAGAAHELRAAMQGHPGAHRNALATRGNRTGVHHQCGTSVR